MVSGIHTRIKIWLQILSLSLSLFLGKFSEILYNMGGVFGVEFTAWRWFLGVIRRILISMYESVQTAGVCFDGRSGLNK